MIVFCRFDYECHVEIAVRTPGAYRQPFRQLKRNLDGFKQDSRSHAASRWLPKQNIENNPMQSTRQSPARMRFGPILDTSGKSAAFLHHRTIR